MAAIAALLALFAAIGIAHAQAPDTILLNGKTSVDIDGTLVAVQISVNLTIIGSKELPRDADSPAPT